MTGNQEENVANGTTRKAYTLFKYSKKAFFDLVSIGFPFLMNISLLMAGLDTLFKMSNNKDFLVKLYYLHNNKHFSLKYIYIIL